MATTLPTTLPDEIEAERAHRGVSVLRLPATPEDPAADVFLGMLRQVLRQWRPLIVLEGSAVRGPDPRMLLLLLDCLEAALVRSGDVKLAGMSLADHPVLGAPGAARLFQVFDTVEEAVNSYHAFSRLPDSMSAA